MFAFGNKHPYHEAEVTTPLKSSRPIALAVHDQRHYVVDGSKSGTFCGSLRSGVGIPYDISTKSGKTLAEDILEVTGKAIEKNGNKLVKVVTRSGLIKDAVIAELVKTQAPRALYVDILEWKTDTYVKADLYCLINLQVLDNDGNVLAENSVKASREPFGGSFWNPKKAAKKGALKALKIKMEELLNHPDILKAFE